MKPHNRLHSFSRWPYNPHLRIELADTDFAFVQALEDCGISRLDEPVLNRIIVVAATQKMKAERQLKANGNGR